MDFLNVGLIKKEPILRSDGRRLISQQKNSKVLLIEIKIKFNN